MLTEVSRVTRGLSRVLQLDLESVCLALPSKPHRGLQHAPLTTWEDGAALQVRPSRAPTDFSAQLSHADPCGSTVRFDDEIVCMCSIFPWVSQRSVSLLNARQFYSFYSLS